MRKPSKKLGFLCQKPKNMISATMVVLLAAICNAIMDTMAHHWEASIFRYVRNSPEGWGFHNLKWWYIFHTESWKEKYEDKYPPYVHRKKWNLWLFKVNKPVKLCDAWHFCKSLMLLLLITLPFTYRRFVDLFDETCWNVMIDYAILGLVWNVTFSLFYNKLLIRKTYRK